MPTWNQVCFLNLLAKVTLVGKELALCLTRNHQALELCEHLLPRSHVLLRSPHGPHL